jgi:ribonuclease VapC
MAAFVIDTSALICVLNSESDALPFKIALHEADAVQISLATVFEASCVVRGDRFFEGTRRLDQLMASLDAELADFDDVQLRVAREAYARYGRGAGHPAKLNMGDCFAYALARTRRLPLLFKGDDFIHTDVEPALRLAGPAP